MKFYKKRKQKSATQYLNKLLYGLKATATKFYTFKKFITPKLWDIGLALFLCGVFDCIYVPTYICATPFSQTFNINLFLNVCIPLLKSHYLNLIIIHLFQVWGMLWWCCSEETCTLWQCNIFLVVIVVQGLYQILEDKVSIRCRQKDEKLLNVCNWHFTAISS